MLGEGCHVHWDFETTQAEGVTRCVDVGRRYRDQASESRGGGRGRYRHGFQLQ